MYKKLLSFLGINTNPPKPIIYPSVRDVVAYFILHYPHKHELSTQRLIYLVYLADWKCCLEYNRTLTNRIVWSRAKYYPIYTDDIKFFGKRSIFKTDSTECVFHPKDIVQLNRENYKPKIDADIQGILDFIIEMTKDKYYYDVVSLVYRTFPISSDDTMGEIPLLDLAKKYKSWRRISR